MIFMNPKKKLNILLDHVNDKEHLKNEFLNKISEIKLKK